MYTFVYLRKYFEQNVVDDITGLFYLLTDNKVIY